MTQSYGRMKNAFEGLVVGSTFMSAVKAFQSAIGLSTTAWKAYNSWRSQKAVGKAMTIVGDAAQSVERQSVLIPSNLVLEDSARIRENVLAMSDHTNQNYILPNGNLDVEHPHVIDLLDVLKVGKDEAAGLPMVHPSQTSERPSIELKRVLETVPTNLSTEHFIPSDVKVPNRIVKTI